MGAVSKRRSFIMGIASLWIYYFHVFPIHLLETFHTPNRVDVYIKFIGFCGVDIFLVLSGFGLYYALIRRCPESPGEYGTFLLRRCSRIYPVFLPVTIFIAFVDNWTVRELIGKTIGVVQLFDNVYAHLWYIPCIMIFYLLVPFYFKLYRRCKHTFALTTGVCALVITLSYLLQGHIRYDLYAIIIRIPVFLVGIYMGQLAFSNQPLKFRDYNIALIVLIAGVLCSYQFTQGRISELYPCFGAALNLFIAPPIVLLVSGICEFCSSHVKRDLLIRPVRGIYKIFAALGRVSLEFYVVHEWIFLKTGNSGTLLALAGHTEWGQQVVCLVITVVATVLVHSASEQIKRLFPLK